MNLLILTLEKSMYKSTKRELTIHILNWLIFILLVVIWLELKNHISGNLSNIGFLILCLIQGLIYYFIRKEYKQ